MILMLENPTEEQLKQYHHIIYLITNMTNSRNYVGMTTNTFRKRYSSDRWWTQLDNKELKSDILNIGIDKFKITIIENNIINLNELNDAEDKYAIEYKSYYPDGYNILKCGRRDDAIQRQLEGFKKLKLTSRTIKREDEYRFIDPNGELILINDLDKFCLENNLDFFGMINVHRGNRKHCKGYSNPNNPLPIYELIGPDNKIYKIREDNICKFSLSQGLKQSDIAYITRGQCKFYNGWRLLKNKDIIPKRNKTYKIISPNGEKFIIDNVTKFCEEQNLNKSSFFQMLYRKTKQTKGWRRLD